MGLSPNAAVVASVAIVIIALLPSLCAPPASAVSAKPQCSITRPYPGATESGKLRITGNAVMASDPIIRVQLRIDDGSVLIANGTDSWHFDLDTARMANGPHTIEAKSFDGSQYSESATVPFTVDNKPAPAPSDQPFPFIAVLVLIIVAGVAVAAWRMMRFRDKPPAQ